LLEAAPIPADHDRAAFRRAARPAAAPSHVSGRKIGMSALRLYLAVAMILVIAKMLQLAIGH